MHPQLLFSPIKVKQENRRVNSVLKSLKDPFQSDSNKQDFPEKFIFSSLASFVLA